MNDEKSPPQAARPWRRLRMLLRDPISLAGVALGLVSLANIFLFVLIDAIAVRPSPYIGILAYMVSPAFLIIGILLIFAGIIIERRRKVAETAFYPRIDLNDPTQRSAVFPAIPPRDHEDGDLVGVDRGDGRGREDGDSAHGRDGVARESHDLDAIVTVPAELRHRVRRLPIGVARHDEEIHRLGFNRRSASHPEPCRANAR